MLSQILLDGSWHLYIQPRTQTHSINHMLPIANHLLQPLIKPLHSLQESLLHTKLDGRVAQIATHRKAMRRRTVQVDLVRLLRLLEDLLTLMPLIRREDLIRLRRRNAVWALDGGQLALLDETGVCHVADIDLALAERDGHVLGAVAVADGADLLETLLAQVLDGGVDDGEDGVGRVWGLAVRRFAGEPLHDLEALRRVNEDGIVVHDVGDDGEVAVGGELVGEQLRVGELVAEDVGKEEDCGVLLDISAGLGDVSFDCEMVSNKDVVEQVRRCSWWF